MKARRVKKLDPERSLGENAARIVRVRLDEMSSFAPKALEAGKVKKQHDMRIAAKRLRYVLEVTGFCFGRSADIARKRARDLQEILGDLHDCDVMLPRVQRHLADLRDADAAAVRGGGGEAGDLDPALAARAPHRTSYRGLEILLVYLKARRELLFERFVDFWAEQERSGTWDRLDASAERVLADARDRRHAAERARTRSEEPRDGPRRREIAHPGRSRVLETSKRGGGGVGPSSRR